jgi:hypothetical protein
MYCTTRVDFLAIVAPIPWSVLASILTGVATVLGLSIVGTLGSWPFMFVLDCSILVSVDVVVGSMTTALEADLIADDDSFRFVCDAKYANGCQSCERKKKRADLILLFFFVE